MKIFKILTIISFMASFNSTVFASTFSCDAVEDLATLVTHVSGKVVVSKSTKKCKFIVNKAKSDNSNAVDFYTDREYTESLSGGRQSFITEKFKLLLREVASAIGDEGTFLTHNLDSMDFGSIDCSQSWRDPTSRSSTVTENIELSCFDLKDDFQDDNLLVELTELTTVLKIVNITELSQVVYIFIHRLQTN